MFLKICQSSAADEDAHKRNAKTSMPSILNPFQNYGKKAPKPEGTGPPTKGASSVASPSRKVSEKPAARSWRSGARKDFVRLTTQGLGTEEFYSDPETLPSFEAAYQAFKQVYSRFSETVAVDRLREREYGHLGEKEHVCLDYTGFGLFSHWQLVFQRATSSFNLAYISANLPTHALYGTAEEGTVEAYIRRRIMRYMNISESDYSMVFTASRGTAYKLLAESYPFQINNRLLTVYDYRSDAVSWMIATAKEKGARTMNASFKWPNLRVAASDLKYKLQDKKKKKDQSAKGLFVFPVQSRVTGAKYSYQWMSHAQANKWHVLLDASALAPKDMDSLALSLFRPEFIVTSFYKVFGADPTGFGCLFIKNSVIQCLHNSSRARGVGMVRIISSGASNSSMPKVEGEEEQDYSPNKHETDAEEYLDAANYVDPVSSFSGPVTQYYLDDLNEETALEEEFGPNKRISMTSIDNGLGWTSNLSEAEEERAVVKRTLGEPSSGAERETGDLGSGQYGDFGAQDSLQKGDSRIGEIDEEDSGSIFPLIRSHQPGQPSGPSIEIDEVSPQYKRGFHAKDVGALREELAEDDLDNMWAHEASLLRGGSNHVLSRIQEDEAEECEDSFVPPRKSVSFAEALDRGSEEIESSATGSPLFCSPPESTDGFRNADEQDPAESHEYKTILHKDERKLGEDVRLRQEANQVGNNMMLEKDLDHSHMEDREVENIFRQRRSLSLAQEDFGVENQVGVSGTNGRRQLYWSPGEGSSQWADQYAMSIEGSPIDYNIGDRDVEESDGEMLDEEGPVVCNGLDHADSQGLNRTNLRLRFLINWLINALLKLRHPTQFDRQGTNLVHIYGPEVHFDRGASVAFNVFDWNGVPVKTELVQRLADRNNISLGLSTLCNIFYPEGSEYLSGVWSPRQKGGQEGSYDGKIDPPRSSNASKQDRPSEIPVVTATLAFVSSFEDVYRLWVFVAKFLDADFVSREGWRYHSLNQEMVVL